MHDNTATGKVMSPPMPTQTPNPTTIGTPHTPTTRLPRKKAHVVISHHINSMGKSAEMVAKGLKGVGWTVYHQNDEFDEMFSMTTDGDEVTHVSAEDEMVKNIKEADMMIILMNQEWADSAECADHYYLAKRLNQSSHECGRTSKAEQRKPIMMPVIFKDLDWSGHSHVELLVSNPNTLIHDGRVLTEGTKATLDGIVAAARKTAQDITITAILASSSSPSIAAAASILAPTSPSSSTTTTSSSSIPSSSTSSPETIDIHLDLTGDFPKPNFKKNFEAGPSSPPENAENWFRQAQDEYIKANYKKAEELYIKAAEMNHITAQGFCFYHGFGREKNITQAVIAWLDGAKQGHPAAVLRMGMCFYNGEGVKQNRKVAAQMFALAAESKAGTAQLDDCSENGADGLSTSQEDASAHNNLGVCYTNGVEVGKDSKKAAELFEQAAAKGYAVAQNNLGSCYYKGKGLAKNKKKAVELFTQAASQGNAGAQYNLGYCYRHGSGVGKDKKKAAEFFGLAAAQGLKEAQYNLGLLHKSAGNNLKARDYLTQAAKQGHFEARRALAKI